jgi:glycosyltransferase involved in cell wall biosynthesis
MGLLPLARRLTPPELRARIAQRIGLGGYIAPLAARAPHTGNISADGVNYIADLRADIGIGESARVFYQTLVAAGLGVNLQEVTIPMIPHSSKVSVKPNDQQYTITLVHLNPPELRLGFDRYRKSFTHAYTIGHWYWEVPRFPEPWIARMAVLDEVWTSSRYTRNILARVASIPVYYIPTPVIVAPELVTRAQFGIPDGRFMFFFAFNPGSSVARKNPYGLIEAYRRAFAGEPNPPVLVIKAHHLSKHPAVAGALREAVQSVGGILIEKHLTRAQMHGLTQLADCVVSLHRAEGFGLLMAEAMALGRPVIATGYSSNMDFMTEANSFPVRYTLTDITPEDHRLQPLLGEFYTPGQPWADPDLDHAAELMRLVVQNPELAYQRAETAQRDMLAGWSAQAIAQVISQRLQEVGTDQKSNPK